MTKYFLSLFVGLLALLVSPQSHAQSFSIQGIQNMEQSHEPTRWWVDVNADGRDDFCFLWGMRVNMMRCHISTGTGFLPTPLEVGQIVTPQNYEKTLSANPLHWADVNGDGYPDLCRKIDLENLFACSHGPTYINNSIINLPIETRRRPGGQTIFLFERTGFDGRDVFLTDLNGDGRSDVCYLIGFIGQGSDDGTPRTINCHISTEAGLSSAPSFSYNNISVGEMSRDFPRGFIDFNGDGYPDFCRVISGGATQCLMNGPSGFTHEITTDPTAIPFKEGAQYVDFNGDGKTDLCRIGIASSNQACTTFREYSDFLGEWLEYPVCQPVTHTFDLQCRLSNGVNWDSVERKSAVIADVGDPQKRWWVDINSDGIADFCRGEGGELRCQLGRGDNGADGYAFSHEPVVHAVADWGLRGGRSFCDAAGTGYPTLCRATLVHQEHQECIPEVGCTSNVTYDGGAKVGLSNDPVAGPSVITTLNAGIGMDTRITYAPMTDPEVYQKSGMGSYPRALIKQSAQQVVKETRAWQTTEGGTTERSLTGIARYFYRDLTQDVFGGSRGFRERSMYTEGSNTVDRTVFFQGLGPTVDASSRLNDPLEIGQVKLRSKLLFTGSVPSGGDPANSNSERQRFITAVLGATPTADAPGAPFRTLARTVNELADTVANDGSPTTTPNPRYRYIGKSVSTGVDLNGAPLPSTQSEIRQDGYGNVVSMQETTTAPNGQTWAKTTTNTFSDDVAKRRLGRLTRTTVTSTAPSVDAQIAALSRSAGNSPNATDTSSAAPAVPVAPPPIRPEVLMTILQLLLED